MRDAFDRERVDNSAVYSRDERSRIRGFDGALGQGLEHWVLLQRGKEIVGAYRGRQEQRGSYYMVYSQIRGDHQGQGLYSALLGKVLATAKAAGFSSRQNLIRGPGEAKRQADL